MNKHLPRAFFLISITALAFLSGLYGQDAQTNPGMENYREQIRRLTGFLEFSLNTLGDPETSTREKETIIMESYAKAFLNDKVQVEDDLDENREILTYKDVQAYLKDVDFFFKQVEFSFDIQDIQSLTSSTGMTYFKVTANRNLKGITVDDQTVSNNKTRYIEINLDEEEQVLKIASIYTTRLNETEEMISWWNSIPLSWKDLLGSGYFLNDTMTLAQADLLNDSTALYISLIPLVKEYDSFIYIGNDSLLVRETDTIMQEIIYDTISISKGKAVRAIREIVKAESLDISGNFEINDLSPIDQMSELKSLNISNTPISDLFPARNLTRLTWLNISGTLIDDLEPIRYNTLIRELYLDSSLVASLEPIQGFSALEVLHLNGSLVADITPARNLGIIRDLNLANSSVSDITAAADMANLERINLSNTGIRDLGALQFLIRLKRIYLEGTDISDLNPLSKLDSLQFIYADRSQVSDLSPLESISALQKIYCDQTLVTKAEANRFMAARPGTLVIYESQGLATWWAGLSEDWKLVFRALVTLDSVPAREQLHQITLLASLDISGHSSIGDLKALSVLSNLKDLDARNTTVDDLAPLAELTGINTLKLSGTRISSLLPLQSLSRLESLDVSVTGLESLEGLNGLSNLKTINLDSTRVSNLDPLEGSPEITTIYCDQANIGKPQVLKFLKSRPESLVIFQTHHLNSWWDGMPSHWKQIFRDHVRIEEPPSREQLHAAINLVKIDVTGNREVTELAPLAEMMRLEELILANCNVTDISILEALKSIVILNLSGNPVINLLPLSQLSFLEKLDISNTPVEKLDVLGKVTSLQHLNCSGTQIKKLDPLAGLKSLKKLECQNTGINNLKPLLNLPQLRMLVCYNTKLSEKKVAAFKAENPAVEVVYY